MTRLGRRSRSLLLGTVIAVVLAALLFLVVKPPAGTAAGTATGTGSATGTATASVGVGTVAPNFSLPNLLSTPSRPLAPVELDALGKDRHHPVVLNFFASWCIPCRTETPLLARAAEVERAKGSSVQFIGVDVADSASAAVPFVDQSGISYPVGADRALKVTSVLYGLDGQPDTFFIDKSGRIIGHVFGELTQRQLTAWLHRLSGRRG